MTGSVQSTGMRCSSGILIEVTSVCCSSVRVHGSKMCAVWLFECWSRSFGEVILRAAAAAAAHPTHRGNCTRHSRDTTNKEGGGNGGDREARKGEGELEHSMQQ